VLFEIDVVPPASQQTAAQTPHVGRGDEQHATGRQVTAALPQRRNRFIDMLDDVQQRDRSEAAHIVRHFVENRA